MYPSTPSVKQFFHFSFSSFFFFFFLFGLSWEKKARRAPKGKKRKETKSARCAAFYLCVSAWFFFLPFFFTGYRWQIDPVSRRVVSNFLSVSAKLLLESRNQVWHEHKTSKYSSEQFCMWFKFRMGYFIPLRIFLANVSNSLVCGNYNIYSVTTHWNNIAYVRIRSLVTIYFLRS